MQKTILTSIAVAVLCAGGTASIASAQTTNPPAISCPANVTVEANTRRGAMVNYPMPSSTIPGTNFTLLCRPPSGIEFRLGSTPVVCEATDARGNRSVCGFEVRVTPPPAPQITAGFGRGGSNLLFRWTGDRVLQKTRSLSPPVYWTDVSPPGVTVSNTSTLVYPVVESRMFFRLVARNPAITDDSREDLVLRDDIESGPHVANPGPPPPRPRPVYQIHIHAILTANDDGSQASTATVDGIQKQMEMANDTYEKAGIEFLFDPATDMQTKKSTLLNHDLTLLAGVDLSKLTDESKVPKEGEVYTGEPNGKARVAEANKHRGKIVVYFRYGDRFDFDKVRGHWVPNAASGGYSGWMANHINLTRGSGGPFFFAHEVGHYLHNGHTFGTLVATVAEAAKQIKAYVENGGHPVMEGLNVFDGDRDWVLDTPPDAGPTLIANAPGNGGDACGPVDHIAIPVMFSDGSSFTYTLKPDRGLVSSYFKGCANFPHYPSPQQIERLRDALENLNHHDVVSPKVSDLTVAISPQGSASDTLATQIAVVRTRHRQIVTASRDGNGNLRVKAWQITEEGQVQPKGFNSSGPVSQVKAVSMGLGLVATALQAANGDLKVIVWQVSEDGLTVTKKGSAVACCSLNGFFDSFKELAACRLGTRYLATAVRDASDGLWVYLWHVNADGQVEQTAFNATGYCNNIALCPVGTDSVLTAFRDIGGNQQVVLWKASSDGKDLQNMGRGYPQLGYWEFLSKVDCMNLEVDLVATAVRNMNGNLKVTAWKTSTEDEVVRKAEATAGPASLISSCRMGVNLLATAVRDGNNNLKVIAWEIKPDGSQVLKMAESAANAGGFVSEIASCRVGLGQLATAVRANDGSLKILIWEVAK